MFRMKRWTVELFIDEHDGHTDAEARLHSGTDKRFVGLGCAALNPADSNSPEIGDELAAARALSDLGHRLLRAAAADIDAPAAEDAHLNR